MSIIDEIYTGQWIPAEQIRPDSAAYCAAKTKTAAVATELNETMTPEQRELWDRYVDYLVAEMDLCYREYFRRGVIFGAKLMLEILGS